MAVSETFFRRIIVEMKRSSSPGVTRLVDDSETGVKWAVPIDEHLVKGEKARLVPITATVETPTRALAVLKTSRPGVKVRLARVGTSPTCRANGILVNVADNIYDDWNGLVVQDRVWEPGAWSSTLSLLAASVEDSRWSHEVLEATAAAGGSTIDAVACFSAIDLGSVRDIEIPGYNWDGKIFQFWVKVPFSYGGETLSKAMIRLSSYPYGDAVHDDDVVGGGVDDSNIVATGVPRFQFDFYDSSSGRALVEDDEWSMVTVRKEAMSATSGAGGEGAPLWSRITGLRFRAEYSGVVAGAKMRVGSVYFGDNFEAPLDTVKILALKPTILQPLALSLDAPSDGPAHVEGLVLVK